jgi:hypothetical protein
MNELDGLIAGWRRNMTGAGMKPAVELDELESHLREEINSLIASGMGEREAFETAKSRLGAPASVGREFEKLRIRSPKVVKIGTAIWVLGSILPAVFLFRGLHVGPLLFSHVILITAGYLAAFVLGLFGAVQIGSMAQGGVTWRGLSNAVHQFTRIATVMVVAGFILGCFWSRENLGSYFRADSRELGGIMVGLWLAMLWKAQNSGKSSKQSVMLLSVGASLVAGLAWFGAPLIGVKAIQHPYGIPAFWPLMVFVALHVGFMLVAVVRGGDEKEAA